MLLLIVNMLVELMTLDVKELFEMLKNNKQFLFVEEIETKGFTVSIDNPAPIIEPSQTWVKLIKCSS